MSKKYKVTVVDAETNEEIINITVDQERFSSMQTNDLEEHHGPGFKSAMVSRGISTSIDLYQTNENYGKDSAVRKFLKVRKLKTKNAELCNPDGSFKEIPSRQCISKEELIELYCDKLLSSPEIALIKGCAPSSIRGRLKKFGIPIRKQSKSMKIKYDNGLIAGFRKNPTSRP